MQVRLPDGTIIDNVPDGTTKAELVSKLKANGYDTTGLEGPASPKNSEPGTVGQFAKGAAVGASDIGNTIFNVATATPRLIEKGVGLITGRTPLNDYNQGRQESLSDYAKENDQSGAFTVGRIGSNIAGSLGAGPAVGKTLLALSQTPRAVALANSIISGGTTGTLANRIAGGAASGFAGGALIDPDSAITSGAIGALAGPAVAAAAGGADATRRVLRAAPKPREIDSVLRGVSLGGLTDDIIKNIRADVAAALQTGGDVSPEALRRLVDYRATGLTPMRSNLTLSPADVTQEQNLVKLSANSRDPAAQRLANVRNENNRLLLERLNQAGAGLASDQMTAGQTLSSALGKVDDSAKGVINNLYSAARGTEGRSAQLDPSAFTNRANDLLDEALLGGKLPADVRNLLNRTAQGQMPLTVNVAEQFKTRIGDLQRASNDPAERLALSKVRQAIDETPLIEGQGQEAIDAFNKARKANAAYMKLVEDTPALKAIRDGMEPDQFINKFVTGPSVKVRELDSLRRVVKDNPDALQAMKSQVIADLKNKATGGAADEVAKISQSAFNKRLKEIGDARLSVFFTPDEISNLKRLGRVASYEQFQPAGSAVNNSNTAAAIFTSLLDKVANSGLVRQIPLGGELIANPAQSVYTAVGARGALNTGKAIARELPRQQRALPVNAGPLSAYLYQDD